jgi:hypothetical protein
MKEKRDALNFKDLEPWQSPTNRDENFTSSKDKSKFFN